ncbi:MAG: DUF3365 domain-containing protein [Flavobacteriaceae bacterium]|nr:DUF3365 domain-containing protein [Flavobacteriaceae bacterium]
MKYFAYLLFLPFLISCNNGDKKEYSDSINEVNTSLQNTHPGKKLMETYCYVCHSPTATMESRVAPPMIAVKKHYISENTTKEMFLTAFKAWMKEPSEEKVKMPGAVKKFGLMPYQPYTEEVIDKIGEYIYDFDIEQPDWFNDHFNQEHGKGNGKGMKRNKEMGNNEAPATPEDIGLEIALSTKAELGKNLMGKLQKEGPIKALEFCNLKAFPITDSMAMVHSATIKRVSDKFRNPKNKASSKEIGYIQKFQKDIIDGLESKPIIDSTTNKVRFYYPIVTNSMCLQCHGAPNETISKETLSKIKLLYPNDLATGYNVNEVRGIWSIEFDK